MAHELLWEISTVRELLAPEGGGVIEPTVKRSGTVGYPGATVR